MKRLESTAKTLLHFLGRFFQTDMHYVAKSGFWLSIGQGAALLLSFGLSVFFANVIEKDVYGQYKFILSIIGIIGALSLSGLGTAIIQSVAIGKEGTLKEAVRISLRWGALIFIASLGMAIYYFLNENTTLGVAMIIVALALPFTNAYSLYGSYFSGKKNFKLSALYWTYSQIFVTIFVIIFGYMTRSALVLVLVYCLTNLLTAAWGYFRVISKHKPNDAVDHSLLSYGKHVSFMNFFGTVGNQLDKILVFHYLGAAELAVYAFAQAIPEQIKGSFKNLFAIALPKYATLDDATLRKSIMKKCMQLTSITALIVLSYILIAPFIFKIFFPLYGEAVVYSQIYVLGLLAIPGISLFGTYFQIKKATDVMYKLTFLSNTTTIILTFLLIYHFGLKGAVIENGISWFMMLLFNYYFFSQSTKMPISS